MVEQKQVLCNLGLVWPLRLNEATDHQEVVVLSRLFLDFREVNCLGSDLQGPPRQGPSMGAPAATACPVQRIVLLAWALGQCVAERCSTQRMNLLIFCLLAACVGLPRTCHKACWSVCKVKGRPSKYLSNFSTAHIQPSDFLSTVD